MKVAVPRETYPGEYRVALTPLSTATLASKGHTVVVEAGAGLTAGFDDAAFQAKGAQIESDRAALLRNADAILQVRSAGANPEAGRADLPHLHAGQIVLGMADPLGQPQAAADLAATGASLFAIELLPRITRAQSMDTLSSMATVAGYKAVLLAAAALPRIFPLLMTAAGTVPPARVLVIGAGVAGLQAIATAKRLGAVVKAYDVRAAARGEVESLGATFLELPLETGQAEGAGGYARAMDEDFYRRQRELFRSVLTDTDVVITTAAIPGVKAPVLIDAEMVDHMRAGSVIVDLAAGTGGNCAVTRPDESVTHHGVTILGPTNLPASVPHDASLMYARNLATLLLHLSDKSGALKLDLADEITRGTLVARDGEVVHPRVRRSLGLDPLPAPTEGA